MSYEDDQIILEGIKAGDEQILSSLYPLYRDDFIRWANRRFQVSAADQLDAYQEAVVILYQNVMEGKLTQLNCSLRTYLFSVGKHLLYKQFQHQQREAPADQEALLTLTDRDLPPGPELLTTRQEQLRVAFAKLGDRCRQLLTLFYYCEFGHDAIMYRLNYKNTDTVKSQKLRCMEQLRNLFAGNHDN